MSFKWNCPYCNLVQTVTDTQVKDDYASLKIPGQKEGPIVARTKAIGCSNYNCLKTTVFAEIVSTYNYDSIAVKTGERALFSQYLLPPGGSKPQPDYVPVAIREDYYEACAIRNLSPKASATLIRRCLQGMIRDFAKICKPV